MTLQQAASIVAKWRSRLKLDDWEIDVSWSADEELCGCTYWSPEYKYARIQINPKFPKREIEHTIKHELLHVRLEGHRQMPGGYDPPYEYSLNVLANVL